MEYEGVPQIGVEMEEFHGERGERQHGHGSPSAGMARYAATMVGRMGTL